MRKTLGSVKPIGEQNIIRLAIRLIAGGSITIAMGFLTSCSSVEYAPESAPRMIVVNEGAAFFIHGPAQTGGADRTLPGGNEVKVLRKDFGYSVVQLSILISCPVFLERPLQNFLMPKHAPASRRGDSPSEAWR